MNLYIKATCAALTQERFLAVGPDGFTMYFKSLMYAKQHLTDGCVPKGALAIIGIGIKRPNLVAKQLVSRGLWIEVDENWMINEGEDDEKQTRREEVNKKREQAKQRKQAQRERDRLLKQAQNESMSQTCHAVTQQVVTTPVTPTTETETETETETYIYKKVSKLQSGDTACDATSTKTGLAGPAKPPRPKPLREVVPPQFDWVQTYCLARGLPEKEARKFFNFHEARSWKLKGNRLISNWEAAFRTWEDNYREGVFGVPSPNGTAKPVQRTLTDDELEVARR